MIIGDSFLNKDITVYTSNRQYRGILTRTNILAIYLIVGIDEVYVNTNSIEAFTVHGMEKRPVTIDQENNEDD